MTTTSGDVSGLSVLVTGGGTGIGAGIAAGLARQGAWVTICGRIAGQLTHPYFGGYPVAKAAVEEVVRNAADEYGQAGIRFNAVRPGFTRTEIMSFVTPGSPVYESYDSNTPRWWRPGSATATCCWAAATRRHGTDQRQC
jgi:NAD(P)-dependent dehydrogenase (short-subunit alcohol dehydrogenase family)